MVMMFYSLSFDVVPSVSQAKVPGFEFSWKCGDLLWRSVGQEAALEEPQTIPAHHPKLPPCCTGSRRLLSAACAVTSGPSKAPDNAAFQRVLQPSVQTQTFPPHLCHQTEAPCRSRVVLCLLQTCTAPSAGVPPAKPSQLLGCRAVL